MRLVLTALIISGSTSDSESLEHIISDDWRGRCEQMRVGCTVLVHPTPFVNLLPQVNNQTYTIIMSRYAST